MSEQQYLSLSEAGKMVGKSRSTMWRAMKSGKLSVDKDENGQWTVSISELMRAYPNMKRLQQSELQQMDNHSTPNAPVERSVATDVLQMKVDMLEEEKTRLLKDLEEMREEMRDQRRENREERDKLLGLVEQTQKQLTHERDRYDEEIKKARARLKAFSQNKKRQQGANNNSILRDKQQSSNSPKSGFFSRLFSS